MLTFCVDIVVTHTLDSSRSCQTSRFNLNLKLLKLGPQMGPASAWLCLLALLGSLARASTVTKPGSLARWSLSPWLRLAVAHAGDRAGVNTPGTDSQVATLGPGLKASDWQCYQRLVLVVLLNTI